jgi:hypothetical protein
MGIPNRADCVGIQSNQPIRFSSFSVAALAPHPLRIVGRF